MIRLLILLITLNALSPSTGLACLCASEMKAEWVSNMQYTNNTRENSIATVSPTHCNNPSMMNAMQEQTMNCDAECCADCLSISPVLFTSFSTLSLAAISTQPILAYINFHSRSLTPELQPPLV